MSSALRRWAPISTAILLLLAAALVALGVALESSLEHAEPGINEHSESAEHGETQESHDDSGAGLEGANLLGIPLESPVFIGGLVAASVVLAAAVWRRPGRVAATLVIVFSIAAGVFDVSEIQHQSVEGNVGLLLVAAMVAALRVLAIVASGIILRDRLRRSRPA
jgi:hypothetical protein